MVSEKLKPRRTRGTPLFRIRNYFAFGVFGISIISGLLFHYSEGAQKLKTRIDHSLEKSAEETAFKRELMREFLTKSSRDESD